MKMAEEIEKGVGVEGNKKQEAKVDHFALDESQVNKACHFIVESGSFCLSKERVWGWIYRSGLDESKERVMQDAEKGAKVMGRNLNNLKQVLVKGSYEIHSGSMALSATCIPSLLPINFCTSTFVYILN